MIFGGCSGGVALNPRAESMIQSKKDPQTLFLAYFLLSFRNG